MYSDVSWSVNKYIYCAYFSVRLSTKPFSLRRELPVVSDSRMGGKSSLMHAAIANRRQLPLWTKGLVHKLIHGILCCRHLQQRICAKKFLSPSCITFCPHLQIYNHLVRFQFAAFHSTKLSYKYSVVSDNKWYIQWLYGQFFRGIQQR